MVLWGIVLCCAVPWVANDCSHIYYVSIFVSGFLFCLSK